MLCAAAVAIGVSVTAIALAAGSGPVPGPAKLATAVHDALAAPPVEGVSATVTLTDHLVEGANLASGGGGEASQLSSSPLLSGASGRLWIAKDGRVRLELQAEKGDTQITWNGHTLRLYDASTNTLYTYTPPAEYVEGSKPDEGHHEVPSEAKIEEAIENLQKRANVTGPTPTDVAGQPAYTVRVSPKESGSLFAGAELSWDAVHGVPLRAAVYSTTSSSPVVELTANEVSYGPVDPSVFEVTYPRGVKVQEWINLICAVLLFISPWSRLLRGRHGGENGLGRRDRDRRHGDRGDGAIRRGRLCAERDRLREQSP